MARRRPAGSVNLMTLDTIGNVTFDGGSNQTRVYSGQKLVSDGSSRYLYDAFGNVDCVTPTAYAGASCPTSGTNLVKDYVYDFKNRMVGTRDYSAGTLTKSSDITIDPLDRPIKQVDTPVGGTVSTTTLVYQGASDRLSREVVAAASTSTRGYWYGGLAERLTISDTAAGRLGYVYDPHGSVSLLLDQANAVKKSYGYAGYGGSIASVTKNATGFSDPNRYQYTGKRWDTATGSYDIGLRRYTPGSSRWLQQDLYYDALANLGLSADPLLANRYMFAGANPVNFVEIDGHRVDTGGENGGCALPNGNSITCNTSPLYSPPGTGSSDPVRGAAAVASESWERLKLEFELGARAFAWTSMSLGKYRLDVALAVGGIVVCAATAGVGCVVISTAAGASSLTAAFYRNGYGTSKKNNFRGLVTEGVLSLGGGRASDAAFVRIRRAALDPRSGKRAREWNAFVDAVTRRGNAITKNLLTLVGNAGEMQR